MALPFSRPTGFARPPVGYGGSSWNYGGQSYAIPTNQSQTPGGATFAPVAARPAAPLSLNLTQAANRQVNQVLNPQLAAQAAYGRQQNAAIQGFAQALMGKLQPIAGQVGADYDQAISQTGALANQAASFLQQANPTPQVQALLQSAGAPAEQQAQIGGQLGQTFGGGAGLLSFLGGAVPGRELAAEKAAAQGQAAQYPLLAALRGQQDLAGAIGQQATARNQILATRGQLYSDARQQIIENNMNRAKERQQEKADAATAAYHGSLLKQNAQRIRQAGYIADQKLKQGGRKITQAGQIATGKLKEADAKRHDAWNIAATKADEVARYHDQTTKSRDLATKARNRAITVGAKTAADANTTRVVHNAATELQASLDSINKKEHDDTMASLTEMGLTGIGADGKPTPKFQVELDKIHLDAQKQRVAAAQGWQKIRDAAAHQKATEATAATAANTAATRANRPQIRTAANGRLIAIYNDGSTKMFGPAKAATSQKPFHFKGADGKEYIATPGPKGAYAAVPVGGQPAKAAGAAEAWPGLSKHDVKGLRSGIVQAHDGVPAQKDINGNVTRAALPPLTRQQAIREAMKHGYSQANATRMANRVYGKSYETKIAEGTAAGPPKPGARG